MLTLFKKQNLRGGGGVEWSEDGVNFTDIEILFCPNRLKKYINDAKYFLSIFFTFKKKLVVNKPFTLNYVIRKYLENLEHMVHNISNTGTHWFYKFIKYGDWLFLYM